MGASTGTGTRHNTLLLKSPECNPDNYHESMSSVHLMFLGPLFLNILFVFSCLVNIILRVNSPFEEIVRSQP